MKLDMHCHIKEGSIDSKVPLIDYISALKANGYQGMLLTDHDSYRGYRYWKKSIPKHIKDEFVVLKGIEYDTTDAGHILCIMPEGVKMRLLELRGMPVSLLIDVVHRHGGILGPAHPCGEKYLSFASSRRYYKSPEIAKRFDFFEVFNACETSESNAKAERLAKKYHKPGIGGSDAHKFDCLGKGYTEIPCDVTCETELIDALRQGAEIHAGGDLYEHTTREKIGKAKAMLTYSFWFYNKFGALSKRRKRERKGRVENPIDPIDPMEIELFGNKK